MSDQTAKAQPYPHTTFLDQIEAASGTRELTEPELLAMAEAQLFEWIVEVYLPNIAELIEMNKENPDSLDYRNWCKLRDTTMKLAKGISNDVKQVQERHELIVGIQAIIKPA